MADQKATLRYFTGTGNSWRVLEICRGCIEARGYTVDMASITEDRPVDPQSELFGFCFPVYALGIPRIARRYLANLPQLEQPRRTFLFVTAGDKDDIGWALVEGRKLLESKGFQVTNSELITMPVNWRPMVKVPGEAEAAVILKEGEKHASEAVEGFLAGRDFHKPFNLKKMGPVFSRLLYWGFQKMGIRRLWQRFRVNNNCTSCGLCARLCPTSSIKMVEGRPRWSASCEQCMRCINFCPSRAILQLEAFRKGSKHNCYHEPHFNPAKTIKEIK